MTCIWRRAETASYRDVAGRALCDGVHWGGQQDRACLGWMNWFEGYGEVGGRL